jgi:hypothetical protein
MTESSKDATRDALNRGLQDEEENLHDPDARPPHAEPEEDAATRTRPAKTRTEPGDVANLENPPQVDGPREESNDGV